jgi:hypothetical protein
MIRPFLDDAAVPAFFAEGVDDAPPVAKAPVAKAVETAAPLLPVNAAV